MSSLERAVQHIRRVAGPTPANDRQLLAAFAATRDEAAFAELVRRHGRLVRGVCRRILGHDSAADDAFQAAFLLLARKAGASGWSESVAGWLHATAWHVAHKARRAAVRRRRHEALAPSRPSPVDPAACVAWRELCGIFDEELARLPERLRSPLALCYLEGRTRDEAAARLGCPLDQVKRRLARGRALLRVRLTRRGVSLAIVGLPAAVAEAPVPAALVTMTVEAARTFVAGGAIAVAVGELVQPSLAWLTTAKLGLAGVVLAAGGLSLGMVTLGRPEEAPQAVAPAQAPAAPQPGRDQFGDPLPAGAIARFGTLRLCHGEGLQSLALSADGKRVLSMGRSDLRLWDTATGQELMPHLIVQSDLVTARANRPERHLLRGTLTADGKQVIALTTDAGILTATWYDDTGTQRRRLSFEGQRAVPMVTRIAFSPDRRTLATAHNGEARLWDLETGKSLHRLPGRVDSIAFAADGRTLATSDADFGLHIWELATGTERHHFRGDSRTFAHIALARDGRWLATVDVTETPMPARDGRAAGGKAFGGSKVVIWDTAKGERMITLDSGAVQVRQLLATADGQSLLVAGSGPSPGLREWDVATGRPVRDWPPGLASIETVTGSADGGTYAAASPGGVIHTLDAATFQARFDPKVPRRSVYRLAVAPDGQTVLSYDMQIHEWKVDSGRLVRRLEPVAPRGTHFAGLARSPNGRLLALPVSESAPTGPSAIYILEAASGRRIHRLTGHAERPHSLTFSPDSRLLASADTTGSLRLWDVDAGKEIRVIVPKSGWLGGTLSFTPDGSRLIGLNRGQTVYVWNTTNGEEVTSWPTWAYVYPGIRSPVTVIGQAISHDGQHVAFGLQRFDQLPRSGEVVVCETLTGNVVHRIAGLSEPPYYLEFSGDDRMLAYAMEYTILSHDASVRLLEVATGRELKSFSGHRAQVISLAFSPDGSRLISGSEDATALVWDISGVR